MLIDMHRRNLRRFSYTLVLGLLLGGLLTKLSEMFLPDSAARDFLTTSVVSLIGPFSLDLVAVAFTIGPLALRLDMLTVFGIAIVALIVRSWM